jgi:hypothetical protein
MNIVEGMPMFLDQWQILSRRIRDFTRAGQQLFEFKDSYGTIRRFGQHGTKILADLEQFRDAFRNSLPPSVVDAINNCVSKDLNISVAKLLQDTSATGDLKDEQIWAALAMLVNFEIEVTFILADTQIAIRSRLERALLHLQRLIVVDAATRDQWKGALKTNEIACEKRGAVHLLWHGIWAFKVDGSGERTDLVSQQIVDGVSEEQRICDGLVLTEWKVASSDAEAHRKFTEARHQAKRYSKGVLAGNELTSFRYLIVVSSDHITVPNDIEDEEGVVYRHINIAVDPKTPSKRRASSTLSKRP